MKKIFFAGLLFVSLFAAAANEPVTVSKKVLESFSKTFSTAQDVQWEKQDDAYLAKFTHRNIPVRASYSENGALLYTIRYYSETELLPTVIKGLKDDYPNTEIKGVTEVSKDGTIAFVTSLRDKDNWYQVKSDAYGNTELMKKFKRADK